MAKINRINVPALDEILGDQFPVLDNGFVRVIDYMGDDSAICQAARISYGAGTKSVSEDAGLINYLLSGGYEMKVKHCYSGDMEVLTIEGWKRWDECRAKEYFIVPDPSTRTTKVEYLDLLTFDVEDENMYCFDNNRMSYKVTSNHKMWFKPRGSEQFEKITVQDISKWGHFQPLSDYYGIQDNDDINEKMALIGFYLGDGSINGKRVSFHLKKQRKIDYLLTLLNEIEINYNNRQSSTYEDARVISFPIPDFMSSYINLGAKAHEKEFYIERIIDLSSDEIRGLWSGLVNSDGSIKQDRKQIEYSSTSIKLINLFEIISALMGYDAHQCKKDYKGVYSTKAYYGNRTTLEARKQYFYNENMTGKVYCTTTSTGMLVVRGGKDKFAFICGNSSPFEMCELKLHIRIPMDAWRQGVRHRTMSINEYSTRYSEAIDEKQITNPDQWRSQSNDNKQGSGDFLSVDAGELLSITESEFHNEARKIYQARLDAGVAREQARKDLPLSTYTEAYIKVDLHNLLHFLLLRMDTHAQLEIRSYANVIGNEIVAKWVPAAWSAWQTYVFNAVTFSQKEMAIIRNIIGISNEDIEFLGGYKLIDSTINNKEYLLNSGLNKREVEAFRKKLNI